VSDTDLIASALRDLAEQAPTAPPAAGALWRAGQRRRRLSVMATSAAAAAVAVAVGLTVAVGVGSRASGPGRPETAALALSVPIRFVQVAGTSRPPCRAGADLMAGTRGTAASCIRFTGTGMTITRVESARTQRNPLGGYQLDLRLTRADAQRFAALTRQLAGLHSPRNRLAVVANGYVLATPTVLAAITIGQAVIPGLPTKPQAEFVLATLLSGR